MRRPGRLAVLLPALAACAGVRAQLPGAAPIVQQRHYAQGPGALARVALLPLRPGPALPRDAELSPEASAAAVADLVRRALAARGVALVPRVEVETALGGAGALPPVGPPEAAGLAARQLGASSVLLGALLRYREPALGAGRPASVAFEVALHEAPSGFRLWTARFDHTQRPLSEDPLTARRYPGGGTRWLSAAELARWGAEATADALVSRP